MARHLKAGAMALLCLAGLNLATARADYSPTISATVTNEPGGLYLFDYTVVAPSGSTLPVSELYVQVFEGATLSGISAPAGFDVQYTPGDSSIGFLSSDSSTDIAPGLTGTFSFLSTQAPQPGTYLIRGIDATGSTFDQTPPGLLVAAPVPEPTGLILGLVGGLSVAAGVRRRRKSTAT